MEYFFQFTHYKLCSPTSNITPVCNRHKEKKLWFTGNVNWQSVAWLVITIFTPAHYYVSSNANEYSWIRFKSHSLSWRSYSFPFQRWVDPLAASWESSRNSVALLSTPGSFCWSGDDLLLAPCLSYCLAYPIFGRSVCGFTYCEMDHQATKPQWGLLLHSGLWRGPGKKNKYLTTYVDTTIF